MNNQNKKLKAILHDDTTSLGKLLLKVHALNKLSGLLHLFIPEDLIAHTRLGSYANGSLVLLVESGVWATKLQFRLPEIRSRLRSYPEWVSLRNIEIKVAPSIHTTQEKIPEPNVEPIVLNESQINCLIETAQSLGSAPESEALRRALIKLAGKS